MADTLSVYNPFASLQGTMCITNPEGTVLYINDAIERRLGYSAAEAIGKKPGQLWGGKAKRHVYDYLWKTIRSKQPAVVSVVNTHKEGRPIEETIHVAPIINDRNEIQYFLELHPDRSFTDSTFYQQFLSLFSKQSSCDADVLAFMYRALGGKNTFPFYQDRVSTFLSNTCVAPTRERFARRYDDELLILAAKENAQAFTTLYDKYHQQIFLYFVRRVQEQSTAEDLTQETFVRAFTHVAGFALQNANYYTYLSRIAHNLLVNHYRKEKRYTCHLEDMAPVASRESDTLWQKIALDQATTQLSEIERTVVSMKYERGVSVKEIADEVGKTENAIKLHLSRARKKLRLFLDE